MEGGNLIVPILLPPGWRPSQKLPSLGLVGGQLVRKPRPLDVGNGITTGLPFESFKFQILTWCCVGKSDCFAFVAMLTYT